MAYSQIYHNTIITWCKPVTYPGVKEGMYSVTNFGDVINNNAGKVFSQAVSHKSGGYRSLGLQMEDGTRKTHPIHRLVAHEYIPKTEEDIAEQRNTVDHKNMITDDNWSYNLQWVTNAENLSNAAIQYEFGTAPYYAQEQRDMVSCSGYSNWGNTVSKGAMNGMATHIEEEVHEICKLLEQGFSVKEVANAMGWEFTDNVYYYIYHIKDGSRWKHVSSQYNIPSAKR